MPQSEDQLQYVGPVREALDAAQIPGDPEAARQIRSQAYRAFFAGDNPQKFQESLDGVGSLPNETKLKLFSIRYPAAAKEIEKRQKAKPDQPAGEAKPETAAPAPAKPAGQAKPGAVPSLLDSRPPGSDQRARGRSMNGLSLPASHRPDARSLYDALTTPLTETFGIPTMQQMVEGQDKNLVAALPKWAQPVGKFAAGVDSAVAGATDAMTSAPLSILFAPLATAEGATKAVTALPKAAQLTVRGLNAIGGAGSIADAAKHVYSFFKTGDTGELGKATVELPLGVLGVKSARGKSAPAKRAEGPVTITGEAEPVKPPDYSIPGPPRVGAGKETQRISGTGPQRRQLEAPSPERTQVEAIANNAGPLKAQVYDWARRSTEELAQLRQQALDSYRTVQKQFAGETAPFASQPGVTNVSQAVPDPKKLTNSKIPQGKGDFTPGGPRVLLDRARAQYEALDKLWDMKKRQAGITNQIPAQPLGGRPTGEANIMRALPAPPGARQAPPGTITIHPVDYNYRRPELNTQGSKIPPSRQLADPEPRVMSPELPMEQNLEYAQYLPREVLQHNIEQMRTAAALQAAELAKQAGKDPAKRTEAMTWINQAKERLDRFQEVYDRVWGKAEAASGETNQPKAGTETGKTDTTPPKKETAKKETGKKSAPSPKKDEKAAAPPPGAPTPVVSAKKTEQPPPGKAEPKPEPKVETIPVSGTVVDRLGFQLEAAKQRGIKMLHLTIDRGSDKKPLVIGINTDVDTPEELAKQITKAGGAAGMARMESADPEHPLTYKFLLGGGAEAPPGAGSK